MSEGKDRRPAVRVTDKRKTTGPPPHTSPPDDAVAAEEEPQKDDSATAFSGEVDEPRDLLDDLRRLQAEFDNYRKRVIKEQTSMAERASARLMERLLPVLDSFERAMSHSDGGDGVGVLYKQLRSVLDAEGLQEIPARSQPFDPQLHEAVDSVDDEVDHPICKDVYRTGYMLKGQVIRPAMVVVARPPDTSADQESERGDVAEG